METIVLITWYITDYYLYIASDQEESICERRVLSFDIRVLNQLGKASKNNMFRLLRSLDGQRVQQQPEFHLAAQECQLFSCFIREND